MIPASIRSSITDETQVVTRFLPEPSGFLHIGHAKAILLNERVAREFGGKFLLRYDDTNPSNEKEGFERAIEYDVHCLEIDVDAVSHSSDWFDDLLQHARKAIENGKAFVDSSTTDELSKQRRNLEPSPYRDRSVEENLRLWDLMVAGELTDSILRLKLDYRHKSSPLRDPTAYRSVATPHHITGNKYKVYPSYDFTCPIVDHLEGVTHVLRGIQYADRESQYFAVCDLFGYSHPTIYCFGDVDFIGVTLSKRVIKKMVEDKVVDGFADPRLPTIQGILNRGLTIKGLRQFMTGLGFSRKRISMEWDKIWAENKKIVDKKAVRMMGVMQNDHTEMVIDPTGLDDRDMVVDTPVNHVSKEMGTRKLPLATSIIVNNEDLGWLVDRNPCTVIFWGGSIYHAATRTFALTDKFIRGAPRICWVARDSNVTVKVVDYREMVPLQFSLILDKWFDTLPVGTYLQVMQMSYYRKISDDTIMVVPTGKKNMKK